ncbi:MAG: glutamate--tRNA ligase family protein [Mucilaginibacter sp.]
MVETTHQYNKTRIAPTPSGYLHLGNVLSFVITAGIAEKYRAKILLRIDDLDRERAGKRYIQDIFDTLNFLGIPWDEGPRNIKEHENQYSQLHRVDSYQQALQQLAQSGSVFACRCSRAQIKNNAACTCDAKHIPLDTENASWRLRTDNITTLQIKNLTGTTESILPAAMQNFIIRKKDGFPAYQLTSVVDDLHYGVDLVVRGEDLRASTLAQHSLSLKLGAGAFQNITFYHHPLLLSPTGEKLSKSAGDTSVQYLRGQGKTAAEIYTILGQMLGLSSIIDNRQQLAELLDISKLK